eukprot:SAG11_NODE_15337_length_581_cov_1.767635_2_plen_86_part_01
MHSKKQAEKECEVNQFDSAVQTFEEALLIDLDNQVIIEEHDEAKRKAEALAINAAGEAKMKSGGYQGAMETLLQSLAANPYNKDVA